VFADIEFYESALRKPCNEPREAFVFRSNLLLIASLAAILTFADRASAQVPAAIAAPGEATVATLHAEGAQVYDCKTGTGGKLAWAFREPIATLLLDGKTVGRHYAGPNWEHTDGSAVVAKLAANAPGKTANDIPWLKLSATAHRGRGTLSGVNTIQRINTHGGVHAGPCEKAGSFFSAPYSADYVFLQKGG
jgi:Protein of unknown function (DUF3455)